VTFLLYSNDYSSDTAAAWEKDVFIRNIRSFNKALGNGYHDDMQTGVTLNQDLIDRVQYIKNNWAKTGSKVDKPI
jgi:hypothetical protein